VNPDLRSGDDRLKGCSRPTDIPVALPSCQRRLKSDPL
jgi:hypothetical protein